MDHERLKRGFNLGYYLSKNNPALFDQLKVAMKDIEHPYAKGFIAGSAEYSKEQDQNRTLSHRKDKALRIERRLLKIE